SWHAYEGVIRRMAGFGHAPTGADPDRYEVRNLHCDVLVVGGGAAGLKAALAAAEAGQRVVLAEQDVQLGGRAAWDGAAAPAAPDAHWVQSATAALGAFPEARVMRRTTAVGVYEREVVTLLERLPADRPE